MEVFLIVNCSKIRVAVNSIFSLITKGQIASNLNDFYCILVTCLFAKFTWWFNGSFGFLKF